MALTAPFFHFFHISYFVLSFDAAKVLIVANSAKYLGYSALICDEWHKKQGRKLFSSLTP
jgi:hypothetical protein